MADKGVPPASAVGTPSSHIDISTPAVVEWGSSDILSEVTFDARRLDATDDAFFKLRSAVMLKATAPTKIPFFVLIHPERIKLLEVIETDAAEPGVASHGEEAGKRLGTHTVCLRFVLTRPPDLVGPKQSDLTPKNKASGIVLDLLRSLAHHESFAIHFPRNVLSQARLASLCKAATSGVLTTIGRQADLTSLYRGKGGQIITEPEPFGETCTGTNSPPSYDELGPGPPPAPLHKLGGQHFNLAMLHAALLSSKCGSLTITATEPSKKRRRSSSGDVTSSKIDPLDVERMCRKMMEEQRNEVLKLVEEQQSKLYDRLIADLKPYIGQELQKLEHRILDHVEERSGKVAEEQDAVLEQRLEEVQDDINDTIESRVHDVDEKVEDEFFGLRVRLEEFIEEEMAQAEERMVEHLQNSASISLQFNS